MKKESISQNCRNSEKRCNTERLAASAPTRRSISIYTLVKILWATTPPKTTIMVRAMTSNLNCVIISPQEINPRRGISGTFDIVMGVLKGLFHSGFRYLSQMADKLTDANTMNVPKFVISATSSMLPSRTKKQGKTIMIRTAIQGDPLFESFERMLGKEPSLAMP